MSVPGSIVSEYQNMSTERRQIAVEYHLQLAAQKGSEIESTLRRFVADQAQTAAETLKAQQQANQLHQAGLESMAEAQDEMQNGIWRICEHLETLAEGLDEGFESVTSSLTDIQFSIQSLTQVMWENHLGLQKIAKLLESPYETKMRELRAEAEKWLLRGARTSGEDQTENWRDSLRLFESVIENPVGMQDCTVWFHIGYLKWKLQGEPGDIEKALQRSQRLSADEANLLGWHLKSLRHLAQVQYEMGHPNQALATIQKALKASNEDGWITFDAARYANRIGEKTLAQQYLSTAVDQQPLTYISMLCEPDLKDL